MKNHFKIIGAILLMGCFSFSSFAEKVKLGEFIVYDGSVDVNGIPDGKGKIETTYGSNDPSALTKEKDLLEGVFEKGQVKNAKLLLHRYNGPLWINSAKFKGTLEYAINNDGTSITYKMIEGKFSTSKLTDFIIESSCPFSITRTPHSVGCDLKTTSLYRQNENASDSRSSSRDLNFYPLQLSELGSVKKVRQLMAYSLNSDFAEYSTGTDYIVELENGGMLSKSNEGVMCQLPNNDSFYVSSNSPSNYTFKKTFPEGVLSYEGGEFYHFSGNNGEKGLIIKPQQDNSTDIFKSIMNSTSIQSTGYSLYQGEIAILMEKASLGNAQAQYDLAMAYSEGKGIEQNSELAQKWIDKAAENGNSQAKALKEAEKEAKEKAEAEELSRKIAEQEKEYGEMLKVRNAGDLAFSKLETVNDFTNLSNSANLIEQVKKLTVGGDMIEKNFRIKVPLTLIGITGEPAMLNPKFDFATLEVINFGAEGKTVLLTLDVTELALHKTFTLSGRKANVGPGKDSGNDIFAILSSMSQSGMKGALSRTEGKWTVLLLNPEGLVSDFYRGMSRSEVEEVCRKLGASQFKQTGDVGKYKVWSLFWLDMQKQYNIFGDYNYQMRNDKKWGDFYFDAQGRLMKWFLYM